MLDLTKPLIRVLNTVVKDGDENLTLFCYGCGVFGHGTRDYDFGPNKDEEVLYGNLMRIMPSKQGFEIHKHTKTSSTCSHEKNTRMEKGKNQSSNQQKVWIQ